MSGYFEIGIFHTKAAQNVGTLWRSAWQLGAAGVFTIGRRYNKMASDTYNTANNIPLRHFLTFDDFLTQRPIGAVLVGVEMGGIKLSEFKHPRNAIYLLGAEDNGLPPNIMQQCNQIVSLEAIRQPSYNVAVAGSLVMYHRHFGQPNNVCTPTKGIAPLNEHDAMQAFPVMSTISSPALRW